MCTYNGWTNVPSLLQPISITFGRHVSKRIHSPHFLGIGPGRIRSYGKDWTGQSQIGNIVGIEFTGSHRQAGIDTIRSLVCANSITLSTMSDGTNDRTSNGWIGVSPTNGNGIDTKGIRMRRQCNMIGLCNFGQWNSIFFYINSVCVRETMYVCTGYSSSSSRTVKDAPL